VTDWSPPTELEEYRLVRLLGQGGMGSVWLAEDRLLDRLVAIKWIAHAEPGERARARFAREARAAARLQHENIVSVYRYGESAGRPYLVAEYIRGESLDKLVKPVAWNRALELGVSLARGLAAAHRHGIVHRDIKPANAILADEGMVKLVDFGLAYVEDEHTSAVAPSPRASGTPAYMAPEVRRGEVATRRSDVYQLGGILYELVTGNAPIFDTSGNQTPTADLEVDTRETRGASGPDAMQVPPLGTRLPPDAAAFAAVVDRCLEVEPRRRFASGEELRDALEALRPAPAPSEPFEGNPYRGLLPFEAEHRAVFFGRAAEARALTDRLRGDAFVLVAGDSGVGKSSVCRAAVLPWIAEGVLGGGPWQTIRVVPGTRPVTSLCAAAGAALSLDEERLVELRDQPAAFVRELRRAAPGGLLVFVDQLEELVSMAGPEEAREVAALLAELTVGIPGLRLLATVRSDFLSRVAELPGLGAEVSRAIHVLGPLTAAGARDAVIGPARATGVRFESESLIDELVGFATDPARDRSIAALPLLAFTLAQLWDARDRARALVTSGSLEAIGGVRGALARHADGVLERLSPAERRAAQGILLRLIAPEHTRVRRTAVELGRDDAAFLTALDALVRGRLVVSRGRDEEATYELAHEGLVEGWPTLALLVSDTEHLRALHARLATAVAEWQRLERAADGLWGARQLADVAGIPAEELTPPEAAFLQASRRAIARRRWQRGVAIGLVPATALAVYAGSAWFARRDLDARVTRELAAADAQLAGARAAAADLIALREETFTAFDAGDRDGGEARWARARDAAAAVRTAYADAARTVERAFLLDTSRAAVRAKLAEVTFERAELAERSYRLDERDELLARLALHDVDGALARRRARPGELTLALEPAGATITVIDAGGNASPLVSPAQLAPGTYLLEATAPERATVRWPETVRPGERRAVAFALPRRADVPSGYVFVPPGRFAYGSRDPEPVRAFFGTAPMHEVETGAYLIGVHEVTYADWIEFLDALPDVERVQRAPQIASSSTVQADGSLALVRHDDRTYELRFAPAGIEYRARAGEPIVYRERALRASQDWRRFPVSGISALDALAYTAWLDRTGRLPRARLCTEREWERAARGVDGRTYPHGEMLAADDANVDITYGKRDGGFGPDMVGSHPASHSVHGLADTAGNLWELTQPASGDSYPIRGGCYYLHPSDAHLANRQEIPSSFRHLHIGFRVCADAPP